MYLDFPLSTDNRGRSSLTDYSDHIRDLIEQVLFTSPGERVNRPDFGCGLLQQIFEPNSDVVVAAIQASVQGALQRFLSDLIVVESVTVENDEMTLTVTVSYVERRSQQPQVAQFTRAL